MENRSQMKHLSPKHKAKSSSSNQKEANQKKEKKEKKSDFEFCKVCNLNHNQGQRHKYFPNHKKALSAFLSRFQSKLSEIRFFLRNPSFLRPEHVSRNRFWCVFCDNDIDELGSSFSCGNAIKHLASGDHLDNLKRFLWKHGGGTDGVDTFMILEDDVVKWDKKCQSLKSEAASSQGSLGLLYGTSNDIHKELTCENSKEFEKNNIYTLKSNVSNGVVPLQYYTNEYQVSHSGLPGVASIGPFSQDVTSSLPLVKHSGGSSRNFGYVAVDKNGPFNSRSWPSNGYLSEGGIYQVNKDGRMVNREGTFLGSQNVAQISSVAPEESNQNVHSGAPPPWFDATEETQPNGKPRYIKSAKSSKLNPKRVGAAWAEKRKLEMEKEKRGETIISDCDANWLPNFGRVWQSGSRKESRKEFEFEIEKQKLTNVESHSEVPIKIQPYISKRMRKDVAE